MKKCYKVVFAKRDILTNDLVKYRKLFNYKKDAKEYFNSLKDVEYSAIKAIWC